jgi:hypothetical protein
VYMYTVCPDYESIALASPTVLSLLAPGARHQRSTNRHGRKRPLRAPARRVPGVRPHPHDLLQEQPVATGMFDERGGGSHRP